MVDFSNENLPGYFLLLEMAFDTKRCVAFIQQALVDGSVRRMADETTLTHCLVLIHKRTTLLRVTLEAGLVFAHERKPTGFERLLNICRRTFDGDPFMRLMTIGTTHFAFEHRMVMWQLECRANFQVALKAGFRRLVRIHDGARAAASLHMQTPWSMARFAAHVRGLL